MRIDPTSLTPPQTLDWSLQLRIHRGENCVGSDAARLLTLVEQTGSIAGAAKAMEMSYSKAWKLVKDTERLLQTSLVVRKSGGKQGGVSYLTETGHRFLEAYRQFEDKLAALGQPVFAQAFAGFLPVSSQTLGTAPSVPTAGLITAAGLSSRMRAFKPMLPVGSAASMIERQIDLFRLAGLDPIVVVTGHRAGELAQHLRGSGVELVHNDGFQKNEMLDSIRMGLAALRGRCDRVVLTPVDVPMFSADTLTRLLGHNADLSIPTYAGTSGHPIVIGQDFFDAVLSYRGTGGLRGVIRAEEPPVNWVPVGDVGILPDADTVEDYVALIQSNEQAFDFAPWTKQGELNTETGLALMIRYNTPPETILHGVALASHVCGLAQRLIEKGVALDLPAVCGAALVHDIARPFPDHAKTGADWLRHEGYPVTASLVDAHMDLPESDLTHLSERTILFYADKCLTGRTPVSLTERFERKRQGLSGKDALNSWRRRYDQALRAQALIHKALT